MFIESIKLKNFRCYADQEFRFSSRSGKIMDIIKGDTGAGKTSLFNSIGWCLFGKETSSLLGEGTQELSISNTNAMHGNEVYDVSVELTIGGIGKYDDGILIVKRTKKYKGSTQMSYDPNGNFDLSIMENGKPEQFHGNDAENKLQDFLSSEFIEFYMFDGEYLAKGENIRGRNLDDAFWRLFKIGALKTLTGALNGVSKEYGAKRINNDKSHELQIKHDEKLKDREEKAHQIEDLEAEVRKYSENIEEKEQCLNNLKGEYEGIKKAKEIIDKLNELRGKHKKLEGEVENARKAYYQSILDNAYHASLRGFIGKAARDIRGVNKQADIPPYIKAPFLNQLIRNHECICGRPLQEGTEELNKVLKLRESNTDSSSQRILSDLEMVFSKMSADTGPKMIIESNFKMLEDKIKEENSILEEIKENDKNKDELSQEEQKLYDKFKYKSMELVGLKNELKLKSDKLNSTRADVDYLDLDLRRIDDQINKATAYNEAAEKAKKGKNIADIAIEVIRVLSSRLLSAFVKLLESELNKIIPEVGFLSGFTANIGISESNKLSVKVIDKSLDPDRSYLPGAKNQTINILLIAAFTRALSEASFGDIVPFIVMDHPFSNLSMTRKIEIIEKFSDLFKNTKILMLIPPGDFEESKVRDIISSTWHVSNCQQNNECKAEKEEI